MPKNVVVNVPTQPMDFPDGTVGGPWRIKLIDGPDPRTTDSGGNAATFNNVQPGVYNATVQRLSSAGAALGPEVKTTQPFTVSADVVIRIDVAAGITVQVVQA